ncbi:porin [uncultured Marinobacter sp.]|uniref:porin n=1 Tax=uncultured Marinobacter sp. TaxID=187379 RepID=UPI0026383EFB|nr:porin [uncultured Marinobacter sp.]
MKKTLIASAIAAVAFSGTAMAQESNLPTVYGNIQYALSHTNTEGGGSSLDHYDNGSTLGVTHDHEIAPGVTGFFKLELDGFNADDKSYGRGQARLDEAYIGVKGDSFGQIWVGSDDSMYERSIDKIANFYEAGNLSIGNGDTGVYSTGEGDLIQYESPSFGGFTLGAAVQVNGDGTAGGKSYPYQLAAAFAVDNLELAFAMDSNDGSTPYSGTTNTDPNNENTYGLRATYKLDDLSITGQYQTRKEVADVFGLMGVYSMGANQFALSYEMAVADDANDTERNTVTLQALHNLSDHMYVYFEGYLGGGDDGVYGVTNESEKSVAVVGAVYYF